MKKRLTRPSLAGLARRFPTTGGNGYLYLPLLSAAIAARDEAASRLIMETALDRRIRPAQIIEIILQSHLFLGFPAMIEALRLFARVRGRKHKNIGPPPAYRGTTVRRWHRQGMAKIQKIYGDAFDRLVAYINAFSPQTLAWMVNDGYGQVLSRPGAPFRLRELCVVATLTVSLYENQLWAHVRGTLNLGVAPTLVRRTIVNCRYFCPDEQIVAALKIMDAAALSDAQTI